VSVTQSIAKISRLKSAAKIARGITKSNSIFVPNLVNYPVAIQSKSVVIIMSANTSNRFPIKSKNEYPTPS